MSGDNIRRGPWGDDADDGGSRGGGPPSESLASRVAALEADSKEMKSALSRVETTLARIEERVQHTATKEDAVRLSATLEAGNDKSAALSARLDRLERTVESKILGPWQIPQIVGATMGVGAIIIAVFNWVISHGLLNR